MDNGFRSPNIRKSTKRALAQKKVQDEGKLKNKSNDEIEELITHEVALENSHPRGEKPKYFSEITEMDGSIHLWFGTKKCCLHLAIDKATNTVVGAYFDCKKH